MNRHTAPDRGGRSVALLDPWPIRPTLLVGLCLPLGGASACAHADEGNLMPSGTVLRAAGCMIVRPAVRMRRARHRGRRATGSRTRQAVGRAPPPRTATRRKLRPPLCGDTQGQCVLRPADCGSTEQVRARLRRRDLLERLSPAARRSRLESARPVQCAVRVLHGCGLRRLPRCRRRVRTAAAGRPRLLSARGAGSVLGVLPGLLPRRRRRSVLAAVRAHARGVRGSLHRPERRRTPPGQPAPPARE